MGREGWEGVGCAGLSSDRRMIDDRCEARWYLPRFNRKIIGKSIELQMNAARDRPKAEMSRSRVESGCLDGVTSRARFLERFGI